MAEALGVSVTELLEPEPPNRRARLEIALERAQAHPRYHELGLPYLKASARLPDEAIEHIIALFDQITGSEETQSRQHRRDPGGQRRGDADRSAKRMGISATSRRQRSMLSGLPDTTVPGRSPAGT